MISRLNLQPEMVDTPLVVSNLVGGSASLRIICLGVELSSHRYMFVCDFFVLGFKGYDIILGMDWLEKYRAVLDCEKQFVTLRDEKR